MKVTSRVEVHAVVERDGFVVAPGAVSGESLERLRDAFESGAQQEEARRRGGDRVSLSLLDPEIRAMIEGIAASLARLVLDGEPVLTRAVLFDKTPVSNWLVTWHQDTTIAVHERIDAPGFGPWSVKEGVPHVRPPASVLESMVTLRIHLDDCPIENGPLKVIPESHRRGILGDDDVAELVASTQQTECPCDAGDVLLMRPLVVHSSSKSARPARRRVLHVECAGAPLPVGLRWCRY